MTEGPKHRLDGSAALKNGADAASPIGGEVVALIELGTEERALLREAAQLVGIAEPTEIVRMALTEFLERRRFQSWVEARDKPGSA